MMNHLLVLSQLIFVKKNGSGKVKKKGKVQGQMDACMATKGDQKIHATFPLAGQ